MRTIVLDLLWADKEEAGQVLLDVLHKGLLKLLSEPLGAETCRETYGECLHFLPSSPWGRSMVGGTHLSFLHSVCFLFLTLIVCFFVLLDFQNHGKLLLFDFLCDKLIWEKGKMSFSFCDWVSLILRSSEAHCGHISKPPLLFHFYTQ